MIKGRDLPFVRISCSYGSIALNTDHNLVKAELQIEWSKMKINKKIEGITIDSFKDSRNQIKYQEKIQERMEDKGEGQDPGEILKNIREACTQIVEEVLGRKDKKYKESKQNYERSIRSTEKD